MKYLKKVIEVDATVTDITETSSIYSVNHKKLTHIISKLSTARPMIGKGYTMTVATMNTMTIYEKVELVRDVVISLEGSIPENDFDNLLYTSNDVLNTFLETQDEMLKSKGVNDEE